VDGKIRNNAGFAIVEILISLVLVSFLLITISAVFPRMTSHRKVIRDVDQARIIAVEALEKVQRASGIANQANLAFSPDTMTFANQTVNNTRFTIRAVSVSIPDPEPIDFIRTVTISVSWAKGGRDQNVELEGTW